MSSFFDPDSDSDDAGPAAALTPPTTSAAEPSEAPAAPRKPKLKRAGIAGRVAQRQPTFGESDDELGATGTRAPSPKRKQPPKATGGGGVLRLGFASAKTWPSAVAQQHDLDRRVVVYALNSDMRVGADEVVRPLESRRGDPTATFDVNENEQSFDDEKKRCWDGGHDECEGLVFTAYEVGRRLVAEDNLAVLIVSTRGGDAARALCGMTAKVVHKLTEKTHATAIVGTRAVQPSNELGKKLVKKTGEWSEVVARQAVHSLLA
jgi:hypothetical protein